jgi:hypothetical protein
MFRPQKGRDRGRAVRCIQNRFAALPDQSREHAGRSSLTNKLPSSRGLGRALIIRSAHGLGDVRITLDCVAKVVWPKVLKILRAAGTFFAYGFEGPHCLTQNSWATSVARLTLSESSIALCFEASPKIRTDATFDFCNTIPSEADIRAGLQDVCFVPISEVADPSWRELIEQ